MKFKLEGILTAVTPIFHGGDEKTGSTPILRTISLYDSTKDKFFILPYISGNGIRGKLRRLIINDFFNRLEIEPTLKMHHTFYSGGVLESSSETYGNVDLELRKEIRENVIPISLFGCSIGNQILTGKLQIGHAFPICLEYSNFLPDEYKKLEASKKSVRLFTDDSFITRKAEIIDKETIDEQAVQMKVDYECFIPGTQFYHWITLDYPNELELSCLGHLLNLFRETPFIGGRSSQGDGNIKFDYFQEIPSETLYIDFIEKNKEKIILTIHKIMTIVGDIKDTKENEPND